MKLIFCLFLFSIPYFIIAQNVGIGNSTPTEKLDVNGNINLNGKLKVNGTAGQPNQVLMTNAGGATVWQNLNAFPNFTVFTRRNGATQPFTVPAGVTKIFIELWGAGAGGDRIGGGGGGAYAAAIVACSTGQVFDIALGDRGIPAIGESGNAIDGGTSSVKRGGIDIISAGGGHSSTYSGPGEGGDFYYFNGTLSNIYFQGQSGKCTKEEYQQRTATDFVTIKNYGDGGNAAISSNTGGSGGSKTTFTTTTYALSSPSYASEPGGGGGGGPFAGAYWGAFGAPGMAIVHY